MTSLRKQLLAWLLPLYLAAAILAALAAWSMFGWAVDFFMDNQLRVFADSHAAASGPIGVLPRLSAHNVEKGDLIVQIWDRDGRLVTTSWPELAFPRQATDGFHDLFLGALRWRAYTLHTPERTVQIVQRLDFRQMIVREHVVGSSLPVLLLIPLSAAILWFGIRMALRRLEGVARAAAAQDEHNFRELPLEHVPCEIHSLVVAVNKLLARLSDAFCSQRRFVQDAAHELRTPITAMTLQLENLKARVTDPTTAEQVAQLEAGLARTKRLVEQLLRLARQEAPHPTAAAVAVQLDDLLREAVTDLLPIADRRRIDLGFAASVAASVRGNRDELRSLVHNLLDNALRYTPEGGIVDVALHSDDGRVTVEIIDNGPGIPLELLPRVFDRFFRIEGSGSEGSGLGLAIAKNAAERNDVQLDLRNRGDGSGLIARMRFVAVAAAASRVVPLQPSHSEPRTVPA
ncbi:MAG: ATP-binding protein [Steroidobacter sp.]